MQKNVTNDYLVATRFPRALAVQAKEMAANQGMPFSAFVRQAVKRNLAIYNVGDAQLLNGFK